MDQVAGTRTRAAPGNCTAREPATGALRRCVRQNEYEAKAPKSDVYANWTVVSMTAWLRGTPSSTTRRRPWCTCARPKTREAAVTARHLVMFASISKGSTQARKHNSSVRGPTTRLRHAWG